MEQQCAPSSLEAKDSTFLYNSGKNLFKPNYFIITLSLVKFWHQKYLGPGDFQPSRYLH